MKILCGHNYYRQAGGEDTVFESEVRLLRSRGNDVIEFVRSNRDVSSLGYLEAATAVFWNRDTVDNLATIILRNKPQLAHFHNTFLIISPSAYRACADAGVPVVQTLHNYRLVCPAATLFRDGHPCEECVGHGLPWPGVRHGCWRGSRSQTALVAAMLAFHRWRGTWDQDVQLYIVPSEFARRKLIDGGLSEGKLVVKPNFVHPDPGPGSHSGRYALFAGRLSAEKGVRTLVGAWCKTRGVPLKIVGTGPLADEMGRLIRAQGLDNIELLGPRSREQALALMQDARFLVLSSECYESHPMVAAEAFACGLPVIGSRLGAIADIVDDGRTGLHVTPGDRDDWATKVNWAWSHPQRMREMGEEARREFEAKYTAERNYTLLMDIYERAMHRSPSGPT